MVSISNSLQEITFSILDPSSRSHEVTIEFPSSYPQGAPLCKLSLPEQRLPKWKEVNTLQSIINELQSVLASFDLLWNVLEDIDKHCVVIDPSNPTFQHTYRRIYLRTRYYKM